MLENRPIETDRSSFEHKSKESLKLGQGPEEQYLSQPESEAQPVPEHHRMDRTQKTLISVLSVIGLGVLILTFIQFNNIIDIPWPLSIDGETEKKLDFQIAIAEPDDIEAMKNKDTDQDGISDYDELKIHNTSPYLADSDSDGISDRDEIIRGEDPNCPKGTNCFIPDKKSQEANALAEELGIVQNRFESTDDVPAPSAKELRDLLKESGRFTDEQLSAIPDLELIEMFKQTVVENPELSQQAIATSTDISNYSPAQIRELLSQQGFSPEELSQFTDEELMQLYDEAINQVNIPNE